MRGTTSSSAEQRERWRPMAKVLRTSYVQQQMQHEGWSLAHSSSETIAFSDGGDKLIPIPLHPTRPDLIYRSDLIPRIPVLRKEFGDAAFEELPAENVGFDVLLVPGGAEDADIQALFDALSNLNFALGGSGLTFRQVEAMTV